MGTGLSKSNLAYANEKRDWRIFADFAYVMIAKAREICVDSREFDLNIEGNVYAIDSTVIDPVSYTHLDVYKRQDIKRAWLTKVTGFGSPYQPCPSVYCL